MGFQLDAPATHDGRVTLSVLTVGGMEIDGLVVRAVSDRELDALGSFIEASREDQ
jgi:hypothetical protein